MNTDATKYFMHIATCGHRYISRHGLRITLYCLVLQGSHCGSISKDEVISSSVGNKVMLLYVVVLSTVPWGHLCFVSVTKLLHYVYLQCMV